MNTANPAPDNETWYTITVVQHAKHPRRYVENDTDKPVEVIACTVLPHLAGDILRATADQIAPRKPLMRGIRQMTDDRQVYDTDDDPAESRRYLSGACWAGNCGECTDRACEHNCGHEARRG